MVVEHANRTAKKLRRFVESVVAVYRLESEAIELLNEKFDLRTANFPVLVILGGDDGPACDETIDLLHEWMDARTMGTRVLLEPTAVSSRATCA